MIRRVVHDIYRFSAVDVPATKAFDESQEGDSVVSIHGGHPFKLLLSVRNRSL